MLTQCSNQLTNPAYDENKTQTSSCFGAGRIDAVGMGCG
jgi:hypothetical protein